MKIKLKKKKQDNLLIHNSPYAYTDKKEDKEIRLGNYLLSLGA